MVYVYQDHLLLIFSLKADCSRGTECP